MSESASSLLASARDKSLSFRKTLKAGSTLSNVADLYLSVPAKEKTARARDYTVDIRTVDIVQDGQGSNKLVKMSGVARRINRTSPAFKTALLN